MKNLLASCWCLVCLKAHGSKCIFWQRMDKNCLDAHFTHPEKLLFKPEIILIWTLCVVHESWQCLTYMKYVIPSISNDYCVKRNMKRHTRNIIWNVLRASSGDAITLTYVPVLSFQTIDVDIVSRLCIKNRIGYTAQWARSESVV